MITLAKLLLIAATVPSTTYGWGEAMCGDIGRVRKCNGNAITASGKRFDPTRATAAIAAPTHLKMRATRIGLRYEAGPCIEIELNDKMNPRYIGVRGFDLTPAAVRLLTGEEPTPHWSGRVQLCTPVADPVWDSNVITDMNERMEQWLRDF